MTQVVSIPIPKNATDNSLKTTYTLIRFIIKFDKSKFGGHFELKSCE